MTLAAGTRLGTFEVEEPIGSGGMGEVYRARDLKLGRAVAIKVLPEHLGDDPDVRARFEREARAVAALSHPNILAIHHLGDSDGRWYAVTELLQGQTLGERLRQGAMPLQKLLRIGRAIAEGLGAAHAQGVIHRDLKPDNVFLTNDGRVKILDFGLARWSGGDDAENADPHSPTRPGVVLGTAGYLSPEQVRAEALDERSDVFGLGCLLYEMLTGHPAFLRGSTVESVVAVLQEDPPPFPPDAPADLCQLITSCLEKNREERLQKAHDVALFLDAVAARTRDSRPLSGVQAELLPERPSPWRRRVPLLLAAVAAVPLAFVAGLLLRPAAGPPPELRYLTHSGRDRSPAASPDGHLVAFTSERDGRPRIWLEQLPGGDETPLTDGPDDFPRFSPDGGAILFARREGLNSSLFRVPTLGGAPRRVVDDATDGDFSPDGSRIAFVRWKNNGGRMDSIVGITQADGGAPRQLAVLPGRTLFHPRWSPDGREIAMVESGESPRMALMVVDAEDGGVRELSGWSPQGVLSAPLWSRRGKSVVLAVSGSLAARQGASTRVVQVSRRGGNARTLFWHPALVAVLDHLGDDGMIIEARTPRTELVEIGLAGGGRGRLTRGNSNDRQPVYSPDGTRIVFSSNRSGNLDVWAHELATGSVRRLTDHPGDDWDPAVMPDGRILWSSNRSGHFEIWAAEPDGARPRQLSHDGFLAENPTATADGKWIVYNSRRPEGPGVWRMRPDGSDARLIVPGNTRLPEVSPDGRHVLYLTDIRLDRLAVRVARVDGSGVEPFVISLSSDGGRVRWMPDGTAIAFNAPSPNGPLAVYAQPFRPGRDTTAQRVMLTGQDLERSANSFGFARDGSRFCVALGDDVSHLMTARGVDVD